MIGYGRTGLFNTSVMLRNPVVRRSIFTTRVLGDEVEIVSNDDPQLILHDQYHTAF